MHPAPIFATLSRGDLRHLLNAPSQAGSGRQTKLDGRKPETGGWNRISIEVSDLSITVEALHKEGAHVRNDVAVPEWPLWLAEFLVGSAPTASKRGPSIIWPLVI